MKKTIGLALGSGGARGFCHIGVLEVLQQHNVPIHIVTGCSMGAIIGGSFAAGVSVDTMLHLASKISNHKVFDVDITRLRDGLARGNRVMSFYRKYVGEKLIEDCEIKFATIATELTTAQLHTFNSGPIWKAVRASMSIPGAFHPVREGDKIFVDGGILKRMPISEARELGADVVIAVDAIGPPREYTELGSAFKVVESAFGIMDWRAAQHEGKDADAFIIPEMHAKSMMAFKNNEDAIQAGREATLRALPQIFKILGRRK